MTKKPRPLFASRKTRRYLDAATARQLKAYRKLKQEIRELRARIRENEEAAGGSFGPPATLFDPVHPNGKQRNTQVFE